MSDKEIAQPVVKAEAQVAEKAKIAEGANAAMQNEIHDSLSKGKEAVGNGVINKMNSTEGGGGGKAEKFLPNCQIDGEGSAANSQLKNESAHEQAGGSKNGERAKHLEKDSELKQGMSGSDNAQKLEKELNKSHQSGGDKNFEQKGGQTSGADVLEFTPLHGNSVPNRLEQGSAKSQGKINSQEGSAVPNGEGYGAYGKIAPGLGKK